MVATPRSKRVVAFPGIGYAGGYKKASRMVVREAFLLFGSGVVPKRLCPWAYGSGWAALSVLRSSRIWPGCMGVARAVLMSLAVKVGAEASPDRVET